jgi:hypothetical protein
LISFYQHDGGDLQEICSVKKQAHIGGGLQRESNLGVKQANHAVTIATAISDS